MFTRELYIRNNATLHYSEPAHGIEIYYYDNPKPCAVMFSGKSQKPFIHYSYRSEADRDKSVQNALASLERTRAAKAERKAERLSYQHTLKAGDVLYASWGYEQTNIDYYQVIEVKGKFVVICEISQIREATGWLCGQTKPNPDHFIGEPMRRKVGFGGYVNIDKVSSATPCDADKSHYYSEYA